MCVCVYVCMCMGMGMGMEQSRSTQPFGIGGSSRPALSRSLRRLQITRARFDRTLHAEQQTQMRTGMAYEAGTCPSVKAAPQDASSPKTSAPWHPIGADVRCGARWAWARNWEQRSPWQVRAACRQHPPLTPSFMGGFIFWQTPKYGMRAPAGGRSLVLTCG